MKIFISYRRADSKYVVDRIRDRLIAAYDKEVVFRDIESIPLGQNFSDVLDEATSTCEVMLVVIGPQWASITDANGNKRLFDPGDYTRIEVETGLAHEGILVIPVLVMGATMPAPQDIPESLMNLRLRNALTVQNDPYFDTDMGRLIQGINRSLGDKSQIPIQKFEPEMVYIPAGAFMMGSGPEEGIPDHEKKLHEVTLPGYHIGRYPVTNSQYEEFVREMDYYVAPEMGWNSQKVPNGAGRLPVTGVTWYDAKAYCEWLRKKTDRNYSLPNEAQWEKACRGGQQTIYPWGDEFDSARCNQGKTDISPVDAYPAQNDYGCFDLVGNVLQWTRTLWGEKRPRPDQKFEYPWRDDERNNIDANRQIRRVVRGAAMKHDPQFMRCSARRGELPEDVGLPGFYHGFRVVINE